MGRQGMCGAWSVCGVGENWRWGGGSRGAGAETGKREHQATGSWAREVQASGRRRAILISRLLAAGLGKSRQVGGTARQAAAGWGKLG